MRTWANPRDPWFAPLVVAVAAVVGSLAALFYVVGTGGTEGQASQDDIPPLPTSPAATPTVSNVLTYAGELPRALEGFPMVPAIEREEPDIVFGAEGDTVISGNYLVPITSLGTGVYRVTGDELTRLLNGSIGNWSALGGRNLPVVPAIAGPDRDVDHVHATAGAFEGERFATYDDLFAAMEPDSGILAFVPLGELRPDVNALGVDGLDITRGEGDPADWPFASTFRLDPGTELGQQSVAAIRGAVASDLPTITTIRVAGDTIPARCSLSRIEATGDYGAALRNATGEYLSAADLAFTTLDMALHDVAGHHRCFGHVNLSGPPELVETLLAGGFDAISVAANHVFDCGEAGWCGAQAFLQTIDVLEGAGIEVVGGGNNLEEALAPAIFEVNGLTVGVLGFDDVAAYVLEATEDSPGTAPLDDSYEEELASGEPAFFRPAHELHLERFTRVIQELDAQVDIVVVLVQSGIEDTHTPSPRSIKALRQAREAGADLIIGNQAHWPQAVEAWDDAFVAYAQGNFIYDQVHTPQHYQGYMVNATFHDDRLVTVELVPYEIVDMYRPEMVLGDVRTKIFQDVFGATAELPPRE